MQTPTRPRRARWVCVYGFLLLSGCVTAAPLMPVAVAPVPLASAPLPRMQTTLAVPASQTPAPSPPLAALGGAGPAPAALSAPPTVPNPGPGAVRGLILLNGVPATRGFALSLVQIVNGSWTTSQTINSDVRGNFSASGLAPGDYLVSFYNDSQRDVIGYWESRTLHVDASSGAAFPAIDFYQPGLQNQPALDAHVALPAAFQWLPPAQPVGFYNWRVHSQAGRSFMLIYQSARIDGGTTSFTWDGAGTQLDPTHRYYWGVTWDAGAAGTGGALFQSVYLKGA